MSKRDNCRKRFVMQERCDLHRDEDIPEGACEECKEFKSRYIEYPIEISKIDIKGFNPQKDPACGSLVKIRPCSDNPDNKTYLGILLGDMVAGAAASYQEDTKELSFFPHKNPAIFVPELGKVVWGRESWWGKIKDEEELREITNEDIDNVWYVKALKKTLGEGK